MDVDLNGNQFQLECLQCTDAVSNDDCFNNGEYVTCVEGVSVHMLDCVSVNLLEIWKL